MVIEASEHGSGMGEERGVDVAADDPGARGRLAIRGRAAARIVELAALEVPGVLRRTTRLASSSGSAIATPCVT